MTRISIFLYLFALLPVVSCGKGADGLYPLEEKRQWTYQITADSMTGSDQSSLMTITNMPEREIEGRSVTPQMTEVNGQTLFSFVGEDSTGVFLVASQGPSSAEPEILTPPTYLLRQPYVKGTQWDQAGGQMSPATGKAILQAVIQGVNETVTVPAGTFEGCMRVAAKTVATEDLGEFMGKATLTYEQTSWYCPGAGLVKAIYKIGSDHLMAMDQTGEFSIQLKSYTHR